MAQLSIKTHRGKHATDSNGKEKEREGYRRIIEASILPTLTGREREGGIKTYYRGKAERERERGREGRRGREGERERGR